MHQERLAKRCRKSGFSLVEILLVVLLLGIILGMSFFFGSSSVEHREVDSAAQELKSALMLARSTSTNTDGAKLEFQGSSPNFTGWRVLDGADQAIKTLEIARKVQIVTNPAVTEVEFRSNGSLTDASVGGPTGTEVVITISGENDPAFSRVITVRKATGSVEMQE